MIFVVSPGASASSWAFLVGLGKELEDSMAEMTREEFNRWLEHEYPCREAMDWMESLPDLSPRELWRQCPNGFWLRWIFFSQFPLKGAAKAVHNVTDQFVERDDYADRFRDAVPFETAMDYVADSMRKLQGMESCQTR
jgi:hypothetical protein